MIVSEARRNASPSTDTQDEAGRSRIKQDALSPGVTAEEDGTAAPPLDLSAFLVEQVGVIAASIGRSERLDRRYRDRIAHRAEFHWDDDRRLEAEFLGSGLARDPAKASRSLRSLPQGCDWMIERWSLLARAADRDGDWTPDQRSLAFDLLGRPGKLRGDDPAESIDLHGRPTRLAPDLASLARLEVDGLLRRKLELAPADALEREATRLNPAEGDDPDFRKLRRHESDLHRRLRWCIAQLGKLAVPSTPAQAPPPRPRPAAHKVPGLALNSIPILERIMAQPDVSQRLEAQGQAEDDRQARPATCRPDPRLAREKAREAARREKRDRRQG